MDTKIRSLERQLSHDPTDREAGGELASIYLKLGALKKSYTLLQAYGAVCRAEPLALEVGSRIAETEEPFVRRLRTAGLDFSCQKDPSGQWRWLEEAETVTQPVRAFQLYGIREFPQEAKVLSKLSFLKEASLLNTNMTAFGFRCLAQMPLLRSLEFMSCAGMTEEGMARFSRLKFLSSLILFNCVRGLMTENRAFLTDQTLTLLAGIRSLRQLVITGASGIATLSDEGLKELSSFSALRVLLLKGTGIGEDRVRRFLAPNCELRYSEATD